MNRILYNSFITTAMEREGDLEINYSNSSAQRDKLGQNLRSKKRGLSLAVDYIIDNDETKFYG